MKIKDIVLLFLTFCMLIVFSYQEEKVSKSKTLKSPIKPSIIFGIVDSAFTVKDEEITKNQTISTILLKYGVNQQDVNFLLEKSKGIFDFEKIAAGQHYTVFIDRQNILKYFVYEIDKIDYVKIDFCDSILISYHSRPIHTDTIISEGVINTSLWHSMNKEGLDVNLAMQLSEIFAWSIDFYGIQVGDAYSVYYERKFIDTTYIGLGKIIAARFTNNGKDYRAFLYQLGGVPDYFDEEGQSLRRAFLKAPLKFGRVTSKFSNSRMHPILRIRRPHHGVDYAASSGTPVMSIGNGTVTGASYKGGYGRRVEIRHNGNYVSGYAHLSAFAKGIKKGASVQQGQIIGYVGSSGLSSGPHLDFRVYKNGKAIDPLNMESPPALPIGNDKMQDFSDYISPLIGLVK